MRQKLRRWAGDHRGVTMAELLVALAVFSLFLLLIDAVFRGANISSRKTELAADVQQNARIAVERLTREIREASPVYMSIGGSSGARAIVFKSARLKDDQSVFCLYVRNSGDPLAWHGTAASNWDCFTYPGGPIPQPPYGAIFSAPCYGSGRDIPCGSYTPIWQRYVGYYFSGGQLLRYVGDLPQPDTPFTFLVPNPASPPGGAVVNVIAAQVETFDVTLTSDKFTVTLKARGQEIVQTSVPVQETLLDGTVLVRN